VRAVGVSVAEMRGPVAVIGEPVMLVATVFAAVWHAKVVAHRVGEPFGTLVLALAVVRTGSCSRTCWWKRCGSQWPNPSRLLKMTTLHRRFLEWLQAG
jgi:hypothetical protein